MRKYATTLIIWATLLVNEVHTLFTPDGLLQKYSGTTVKFHGMDFPMQWFVWLISNSLWGVLVSASILLYRENRINRTTVAAYFIFCLTDTAFFFANYKQSGYEAIYTFLLIAWVLIYNYGTGFKRQGNITAY